METRTIIHGRDPIAVPSIAAASGAGDGMLAIPDAAIYCRQAVRDYGLTVAAARQVAKMLLRGVIDARSGRRVKGIRRWPPKDFSMRVPFDYVSPVQSHSRFRIASVCHMFYPALATEFRDALANVPGPLDVLLSTDTEAKRAEIAATFACWSKGALDIRVVPNRGRDIAPKFTAFRDVADRYDLVLYLHTKRTIREREDGSLWDLGEAWRRHLLHNLCGSPEIVASILEAFHIDSRLGLVMAQHWAPLRSYIDWHQIFFAARDLARRMGVRLTPAHVIDFPSGSMFWARPAALRPLFDLRLTVEDFPLEAGQQEGTLAHALERLVLFACEAAGYRWLKVCDPACTDHPETVVPIDAPESLGEYWRQHGFRLTGLTN